MSKSLAGKNKMKQIETTKSYHYSTETQNYPFSMKTLNLTNLTIAVMGLLAVVFFGVTLVETEGLNAIGVVVGYATAIAIMAVAGKDNVRTKRLV